MSKFTVNKELLRHRLFDAGMSSKQVEEILSDVPAEPATLPKWLVILLKSLAYAIGLILAGYGTTAAAQTLIHF